MSSVARRAVMAGAKRNIIEDRSGCRGHGATAGGAAAVELQPVSLDVVIGSGGEIVDQVAYGAVLQVADVAAGDTDQVVVVTVAKADAVAQGAILQQHAAEDVEVCEEAHGAEDGGAADVVSGTQDVVDGEVAALGEHGSDNDDAGGGDPVIEGLESTGEGIQFGHSSDTWYQ
jgi:hypothetical protein